MVLTQDEIKRELGKKAAEYIEAGMLVGLGSGTTMHFFIEALAERCRKGLNITAVASSTQSFELARSGGIKMAEMDTVVEITLTVDGADEIDPKNRMIKGGGGAHTREKILTASSDNILILVDESKLVDELGAFGLPIEILTFAYQTTISKIQHFGYMGTLRRKKDGSYYLTDNGNYIFDVRSPRQFISPEATHEKLKALPGVVETGFFFDLPMGVLVGYRDGKIAFR